MALSVSVDDALNVAIDVVRTLLTNNCNQQCVSIKGRLAQIC